MTFDNTDTCTLYAVCDRCGLVKGLLLNKNREVLVDMLRSEHWTVDGDSTICDDCVRDGAADD